MHLTFIYRLFLAILAITAFAGLVIATSKPASAAGNESYVSVRLLNTQPVGSGDLIKLEFDTNASSGEIELSLYKEATFHSFVASSPVASNWRSHSFMLPNLPAGLYRVRVQVTPENGEVLSVFSRIFEIAEGASPSSYCNDRFSVGAVLQQLVSDGQFTDCPAFTMPVTFGGEDIDSFEETLVSTSEKCETYYGEERCWQAYHYKGFANIAMADLGNTLIQVRTVDYNSWGPISQEALELRNAVYPGNAKGGDIVFVGNAKMSKFDLGNGKTFFLIMIELTESIRRY